MMAFMKPFSHIQFGMQASGANELRAVANAIRRYPQASARASTQAANDVAGDIVMRASRDMAKRYNLPAAYLREQFRMLPAKGENGTAVVKVRRRNIRQARFGAKQMTTAAKRAKGDPSRSIAAGRKQAGISVKILRDGARKTEKGAFFLPLRAGKVDGGNGLGIFWRHGGQIEHVYGPAPYQVFDDWVSERRPDLQKALVKAWRARLAVEIRRSGK